MVTREEVEQARENLAEMETQLKANGTSAFTDTQHNDVDGLYFSPDPGNVAVLIARLRYVQRAILETWPPVTSTKGCKEIETAFRNLCLVIQENLSVDIKLPGSSNDLYPPLDF